MKPQAHVYLLASSWSWDSTHLEFATISIESHEQELEDFIYPDSPCRDHGFIARICRKLADNQNGSAMGSIHLRRLYRVVEWDGGALIPLSESEELNIETLSLNMRLRPLCAFGPEDKLIPIVRASTSAVE